MKQSTFRGCVNSHSKRVNVVCFVEGGGTTIHFKHPEVLSFKQTQLQEMLLPATLQLFLILNSYVPSSLILTSSAQ
jgi:hypothetical protein